MMNKFVLFVVLPLCAFVFTQCGSEELPEEKISAKQGDVYELVTENSHIFWSGQYIKDGKIDHGQQGIVKLKNGTIGYENGAVQWGEFEIDMTQITHILSQGDDGSSSRDLISHLKGEDFFETDKYPLAKVMVTSMTKEVLKGTLTIKDYEMPFEAPIVIHKNNSNIIINGNFQIDLAPMKLAGFETSREYVSSEIRCRLTLEFKKQQTAN